jgi:tetratricopeptide (TPR) repeat protein
MRKFVTPALSLSLIAAFLAGSLVMTAWPGGALPLRPILLSQLTADDYYRRAQQRFDQKDYRGAITEFNEALRLKPDYAEVYNNRGRARQNLQDYQGAIKDYDQAIRFKPSFPAAFFNRGRVRAELRDDRGSIADYDQAIRIKPDYAVAYAGRGEARLRLQDYQGAIADFDQAIRFAEPRLGATFTQELKQKRELALGKLNGGGGRQASTSSPPAQPATNTPVAANSASVDVYGIAKQTTVRIDGQNPGSGVIIARSGNTYYVLTAKHVVVTADEYQVVTANGKKFQIDYSRVKKFANLDLAVVEFTSSENLPVAQLGNSEQIKQGDNIFVSGWPIIDGSSNHQVTDGRITGFRQGDADGYELSYNNATGGGMSGGPIFNAKGQVIGIHGRGGGNPEVGKIGINLGMPIHLFLRQAPQAGLNIQQLGLRPQS